MARSYVQEARAEAASAKRVHVLDTTIDMLGSEPLPKVTLDAVATRAGSSRSTVYLMFGSRSGLFEATARHLLDRVEFHRLVAAVGEPDPRLALERALAESVRLYAIERDVSRALWSWADLDADAAGARRVLDDGRAEGTAHLVDRLADAGLLRDDVKREEAADVLYLLTSFDSFDLLFTDRGLDAAAVTERFRLLVGRALLRS
jgi:AcrR family transcriptional regulator